jgi:cell wall-associated NlpC family hydrolase
VISFPTTVGAGRILALCVLASSLCAALPASANRLDSLGLFLQERGMVDAAPSAPESTLSQLVVHAMGYLGVPYRLGGGQFDEGVDCSGFVRVIFQDSVGVQLPRVAREQAEHTQAIDAVELRPGDLVFFNTLNRPFSHVGIYVGEGRFIHSPRSGAAVRVEDMHKPYWLTRFEGARRVVGPTTPLQQAGL